LGNKPFEEIFIIFCPIGRCAEKMFDGSPNEINSGKQLMTYTDFKTLEECKQLCEEHSDCEEFRIKNDPNGQNNLFGCVLMRAGTTYSGWYQSQVMMYKLVQC